MSIASAALALGREFAYQARTLTFKPLTYEAVARFSVWVEDRARLVADRGARHEGDAEPWREAILRVGAGGAFEPGGDAFEAAIRSPAGNRKLVALMLALPPAEAEELAWELTSDEAVAVDVLKLCGELNADPLAKKNRMRPAPPATSTR